jgi:hypothetical protein
MSSSCPERVFCQFCEHPQVFLMLMTTISLLRLPSPGDRRNATVADLKLRPSRLSTVSLWAGCGVVFVDWNPQDSLEVIILRDGSSFNQTLRRRDSLFVCGTSVGLRPHRNRHRAIIWHIPESFCSRSVFEISSDGELSGSFSRSGPMCLFAFPFPTKYQLSAFLEGSLTSERNVLIQFFVDNLGRRSRSATRGRTVFSSTRDRSFSRFMGVRSGRSQ